jgi:hypothetical protein
MLLIEPDHSIGAMLGAETAMPAYERLIVIFIPEHSAEYARLDTCAAAGAFLCLQQHPAALSQHKRVLGTGTGARRVLACPACR